jgi:transposase
MGLAQVASAVTLHRIPLLDPPAPAQEIHEPEASLRDIQIHELRQAICLNQISFPSQVPVFPKHDRPDLQQKLAQLYFVLGWSCPKIGARYGLSRARVLQILNSWKRRAVEVGWIQRIPSAESYASLLERPRILVALQTVVSDSEPPVLQPVQMESQPDALPEGPFVEPMSIIAAAPSRQAPKRTETRSHRPRRKFDMAQIVAALKELAAGRSVTEVASRIGASESSVRNWKEQYGPLVQEQDKAAPLPEENDQLNALRERLVAVEATLTRLITNSYTPHPEPFVPLPGIPALASAEHRESL